MTLALKVGTRPDRGLLHYVEIAGHRCDLPDILLKLESVVAGSPATMVCSRDIEAMKAVGAVQDRVRPNDRMFSGPWLQAGPNAATVLEELRDAVARSEQILAQDATADDEPEEPTITFGM